MAYLLSTINTLRTYACASKLIRIVANYKFGVYKKDRNFGFRINILLSYSYFCSLFCIRRICIVFLRIRNTCPATFLRQSYRFYRNRRGCKRTFLIEFESIDLKIIIIIIALSMGLSKVKKSIENNDDSGVCLGLIFIGLHSQKYFQRITPLKH